MISVPFFNFLYQNHCCEKPLAAERNRWVIAWSAIVIDLKNFPPCVTTRNSSDTSGRGVAYPPRTNRRLLIGLQPDLIIIHAYTVPIIYFNLPILNLAHIAGSPLRPGRGLVSWQRRYHVYCQG